MDEEGNAYKDIKALQSNLLVLSQKVKHLVHNEKILGRNILILNKKIAAKSGSQGTSSIDQSKLDEIIEKQKKLEKDIKSLQGSIEIFSKRYAKAEDLKEMKYIIDNINPLEYTTVDQVKKLIKENKS